jgi:hypothetical protein
MRMCGGKLRSLREDERDEIEAVKYLIKYVLSKPNVEDFRVWEAVTELNRIGQKYVISGIIIEEELNELLELDDMKEVISKMLNIFANHLGEDGWKKLSQILQNTNNHIYMHCPKCKNEQVACVCMEEG